MKFNAKKLLDNKYLLYLLFFISVITVFGFITTNNFTAVILFLVIALLTSYFSKNMIIILGSAILGTHVINIINSSLNIFNFQEGFKEGNSETYVSNSEPSTSKLKEEYSDQKLTPATIDNIPNKDSLASKTDKAKKTEKAYDLLENNLTPEKIQSMSGETTDLLNRQSELMKQMKELTPILQQTMGIVNSLDINSITDMAEKVTKMIPKDLVSSDNIDASK